MDIVDMTKFILQEFKLPCRFFGNGDQFHPCNVLL